MKRIYVILLGVCIMLNIICFANAKTADELITENKNTYSNDLASVKVLANEQIHDGAGDNISFDNSLAQYIYTDVYGGEYDNTFESHISDDYFWVIFSNETTKEFRYDSELLEWKDSGSGTLNPFYDKEDNIININFNFDNIVNIACQKIDDSLEEIKLVRYNSVYMIYAKSADKEYAIPYSSIADKYGIYNGEVYIANELIKKIQGENEQMETEVLNEMSLEEQKTYGGSGTNASPNNTAQSQQQLNEEQPKTQEDTAELQADEDTEKCKLDLQLVTIVILSALVVGAVIITVVSVSKHKKR